MIYDFQRISTERIVSINLQATFSKIDNAFNNNEHLREFGMELGAEQHPLSYKAHGPTDHPLLNGVPTARARSMEHKAKRP